MSFLNIVLVGPWERVAIDLRDFEKYLQYLRSHLFVRGIIYASSDPSGIVPSEYFDVVCSTHSQSDLGSLSCQLGVYDTSFTAQSNLSFSPLYENIKAGVRASTAPFTLKARSDLKIKNLGTVWNALLQANNKLVIDHHVNHSLLMPLYFSDMLIGAKTDLIQRAFSKDLKIDMVAKKKLNLSPFCYRGGGCWSPTFAYNEYRIWATVYSSLTGGKVKKQFDVGYFEWKMSVEFLRDKLLLLDRELVHERHARYNTRSFLSRWVFKQGVFQFSRVTITFLVAKGFFLFCVNTLRYLTNQFKIR